MAGVRPQGGGDVDIHARAADSDDEPTEISVIGILPQTGDPNNGDFGRLIIGVSGPGVDIYVPASLWADACELLREPNEEMEEDT